MTFTVFKNFTWMSKNGGRLIKYGSTERCLFSFYSGKMVGQGRLELPTSRLSVVRSNQLSYKPSFL